MDASRSKQGVGIAMVIAITVLFTAFIAATYGFGIYLFPVLMSDIRADIGFTYSDIAIITALSQIGFLAAAVASGALTHVLGAGRIVLGSMIICALALAGLHVAAHPWAIGALLTVLGAMAASVWVPMVEICRRLIPDRHRAKTLGLMSSGTSYGVFINGLMVPVVLSAADWRTAWLAVAILTALVTAIAFAVLSPTGILRRPAPASEVVSHRDAASAPHVSPRRIRQVATMRSVIIWLMMFLGGYVCISFQTYLSAYLREELTLSIEVAGTTWSVIGAVGMVGGLFVGSLADRVTIRWALGATFLLLGAAGALLLVPPAGGAPSAAATVYTGGVAFGLAFYAIFGLFPAYMSRVTDPQSLPLVSGIGHAFLGLGGMSGNFVGGQLRYLTGSFEWTYHSVVAGAAVLVLMLTLLPSDRARGPARADA